MSTQPVSSALSRAHALLEIGRGTEAVGVLTAALAEFPDNHLLLCELARAYRDTNQMFEARTTAQKAVATGPEDGRAYYYLSLAYADGGALLRSVDAARKAVCYAPNVWWSHARLGVAVASIRPPSEEAMLETRRAVEIAPDNPETYFSLGLCAQKLGRTAEAIAAYERTIAMRPDHAAALNNLGLLHMKRGRLGAAGHGLRASIAANPNLDVAKHNIDILARRFVARFYWAVPVLWFVVIAVVTQGWPRYINIAIGVAALVALALFAAVMDRRLPPALRSYYRRLLILDKTLGLRVLLLVICLLLVVSVAFMASDAQKGYLVFFGWISLLLGFTIARTRRGSGRSPNEYLPRR